MGRYERLKTEIESGNGAQPLSESRYERLKKEMGESSSVSSTKTKKTKKPAPSSLDNRPKSETKKTTAAPPAPAPAKARKTNSGAVTKKSPVYIRSTKAAPAVDPSAYGYDPMVAQDLQNRAAQSKPGVMQALGARREGQTVYRVDDMPSLGTRVAGTVSGAAKTYGGSMAGLGAFALEAVKKLDESVSTSHRRAVNDAEHALEARLKLLSDSVQRRHGVGAPMTQEERDRLRKQAELDEARVRLAQEYQDKVHAPLTAASDALYRKGAEMEAAGQEDIERAKAGLGAVGRFGVDVGVAGLQMGMDYIPALLTGGSSALAPMFLRSAGGAAITGKESGADFSDRAVYALGSGALSAVTEQISNIAGPFRKMFGVGVADRIASRLVSRFGEKQTVQIMSRAAQTAAGRAALSAFGEGFEEVAEAVLQTPLQKATIDPDAKFDPVQAGYDFLVGAALGGLGGVSDTVLRNPGTQTQAPVSPETRAAEIQSIQKQAEQEAADWIESLNIPRPVDLNAVNAQADQDASAIVRDMFSQKPVQPTSPESVMKIIQDIQREQQARPGSILLNGDQLTQINQEIAKQQAATVDVDSLLKGRARLDYEQLSPDTQAAVDRAYEQGTAGMDAEGRIFRIHPEDHIDRRDAADVGRRRSLNAFQFDHPELHRFFAGAAQWLKSGMGQKGGQIESAPGVLSDGVTPSSHDRYWRTSRMQPEPVVRLLDEFGLSYAEIDKALDAIIKDRGQENYAAAKKVELVLDEMLTNGWTDLDGRFLPGIPEYVDATSKIAGSLNAEQEPDLGIMGREIERLYGKQDAAPLTPDGQNGTIQETSEMEETPYENRTRAKREARPEGRREFLERSRKTLSGGFESGDVAFGFRTASHYAQISQIALGVRQGLKDLGVPCEIIDGHVEINLDGYTQVQSVMQTASAKGKLVLIGPEVFGDPLNAAGHEAFHFWRGTEMRTAFEDILGDQIVFTSEEFEKVHQAISEDYFGGEVFLSDELQANGLLEEIYAYIAGHLHSGEHEAELRSMLRDYDAVKSAWNQLAEYGRSHPAEMPPSIQWGQETGPDLGILGREIDRLYGKSDTTPSDGLGAADAGTVNTDYDRLQAQSSEFHPEGENPARPVDVPKQDFDGRDIAKSASTIMGAKAIPDEVIPMIEQMIADGEFSHDRISNAASLSRSREKIQTLGFDAALESYRNDVRQGVASKDTVTLGQLLLVNAANAGDGRATAELLFLYSIASTNIAQAQQAQSILRKLDPEYQLYAAQKAVDNLNRANDRRMLPVKGITADDALAAYQNVVDAMRDAFQEIANAERGTSPRSWVEQLSQDLARNVENRAFGSKNQSASIYSTLLNDLNSLMHNFVRTERGEVVKRSASDKIADLFANRAEYARAWEQAKNVLRERYGNDPQALDTLEDFLNSTMNYNGTGSDADMMRAVAEAALENDVNLKDLVIRGEYDLDALAGQIADTLLQKTNASGPDVAVVQDAVRRYIQNRRESTGKTASRYIHSDIQKTIREIGTSMAEIIRSGADSKADVLNKITSALIRQYGIGKEAAPRIAEAIAQDYETTVKERARTRLEAIFKDRPKKTQRSVMEKFEEMVNLGAFSGSEFNNKAVRKLFGLNTGAEISPELIQKFLDQTDQKGRDAVMDEIVKDLASQLPSTFRAKYDCLRYLAMLGNPRTHIRNILGNTLFQIPVTAKNRVGAAVEAGYNFFSGGRLERTKSLTGVNPASQLAKECRADWSNVSDFLSGSKYSEGRITARDIESEIDPFQNSNPLFKGLGKLSDMNGQLLSVEDTAAKRWIYTQSLAGYLKANGIKSISEADPQLLNRARNYAAQEAMRNTFNDHNAFSDFVAKLSALPNSENKWARRAGYVTEGLLPFKRTPANILSRAVEYSPVGAAASIADLVNRGVRGQATVESVATGIDRLAAGLTGTVLLAVGFLLNGYFSGGDDEDDKQRDFNSLTGHQSYALELENGTSVTLDWLAPEAIPFFMGVELAHAWQDGGLSWEDALNALKNMSGPMLEMSMLQGLNDVIEDASYAQYHGGNVPAAFIVSAATNYATQIFPTLFGQLERSTENRRMTTYADKNSPIAKDLQFFLGKTSQKIPGLDYHQIPYIDEWGREESSGDPISRTFNNILNPAYMSQVQIDNVEKELQRLKDTTGNSSVFPAKVDKSFKVGDEMKYLTADEYTTFAKTVGQTRRDLLDRLMKQPGYKRLSDEQKAQAVASVYEYATGKGKMEVSKWKPDDSSIVKGVLKSMLPVESYILYRLNSDRDKSGSVNGAESALTLLELNGLSNQQRGKAWDALNDIKEDKNPFIGALPEAGVQSKTAIDIYDRYRELNNARMKPKDKAAEFLSYVRGLGLTSEQLKAVKNTYTFFGSYPIEW